MGKQPVICPVVLLFLHSRPSAVARLVSLGVVLAIYRVLRSRRLAHIGKEVLKRVPASTYGTSFVAALSKRAPDAMRARPAQSVRRIALNADLAMNVHVQASA